MKKVAIVEYGVGNLDSVARSVEECGGTPLISREPRELKTASYIILPGVGAFAIAMRNLRELGLCDALTEQVSGKHIPFLGICLGMQLMATRGWEGGQETPGLGWIEGEVRRLQPGTPHERVPHVGWNQAVITRPSPLFDGLETGKDFYFVHSFHLECRDRSQVIACTPYCGGFASAIGDGHVFGVQFHPEKSQRVGFRVLKNFLSM
jgi:glutamine amidotransferase